MGGWEKTGTWAVLLQRMGRQSHSLFMSCEDGGWPVMIPAR